MFESGEKVKSVVKPSVTLLYLYYSTLIFSQVFCGENLVLALFTFVALRGLWNTVMHHCVSEEKYIFLPQIILLGLLIYC